MEIIKCSVPGCERSKRTKGMCSAHYQRMKRHSDPLLGRTPNGEPYRHYRDVVLPYEGNDCLIWPYAKGNKGYGHLWLEGKVVLVSRALCEEVNGPPPGEAFDASHSCGRGHEGCVTKKHLSWKTRAENMADTLIHGTLRRGERNGQAKITEPEAREILAMKGKETQASLAARFKVSQQTIGEIHAGRNWAWLSEEVAA